MSGDEKALNKLRKNLLRLQEDGAVVLADQKLMKLNGKILSDAPVSSVAVASPSLNPEGIERVS